MYIGFVPEVAVENHLIKSRTRLIPNTCATGTASMKMHTKASISKIEREEDTHTSTTRLLKKIELSGDYEVMDRTL